MDQSHIGSTSQFFAGKTMQATVDFNAQHRAGTVRQTLRQRAHTSTNFQDHVGRSKLRGIGDQIDQIQID